jgi:hypothetical protein
MEAVIAAQLLRSISFPSPPRPSPSRTSTFSSSSRSSSLSTCRHLSFPILPVPSKPDHLLTADDAHSILHRVHLLPRCIRVALVHPTGRTRVLDESLDTADKGTECEVDVAKDVEREAKVGEDDDEEGKVGGELEEVWRKEVR